MEENEGYEHGQYAYQAWICGRCGKEMFALSCETCGITYVEKGSGGYAYPREDEDQ